MENKLLEYLPPFMRQFKEIKEITRAETEELYQAEQSIEQILNNAYIEECNEDGIARYEKILNITPGKDDSLDIRKTRVLLQWNSTIPFTLNALKKRLSTICGQDGYSIEIDSYTVSVKLKIRDDITVEIVSQLLDKMLPMNMQKNVMVFNSHKDLEEYTHDRLHEYTHEQLRKDVLD